MKILGGQFKGRNIFRPETIRPTQNITRKALFDLLGQDMAGVRFLDLFAGSGAVGIEALSRGAEQVVFVDKDPAITGVIWQNLGRCGLLVPDGTECDRGEVLTSDVFAAVKLMSLERRRFDVIFLDPPYGRGLPKKTLKTLKAYDILASTCYVVVEHSRQDALPQPEELGPSWRLIRHKRYGKTYLAVWECGTSA